MGRSMSRSRHKKWDKFARMIKNKHLRERGSVCMRCLKIRPDLECHHVLPITKNPELEKTLSNILIWCSQCHRDFHRKPLPPDRREWDALMIQVQAGTNSQP